MSHSKQRDILKAHLIKTPKNHEEYCVNAILAYCLSHRHFEYSRHDKFHNEQVITQSLIQDFFCNKDNSSMTVKKLFNTEFGKWYQLTDYAVGQSSSASAMTLRPEKQEIANQQDKSQWCHIELVNKRDYQSRIKAKQAAKLLAGGMSMRKAASELSIGKATITRLKKSHPKLFKVRTETANKVEKRKCTPETANKVENCKKNLVNDDVNNALVVGSSNLVVGDDLIVGIGAIKDKLDIIEELDLLHDGVSPSTLTLPDSFDYTTSIDVCLDVNIDDFDLTNSSRSVAERWLTVAKQLVQNGKLTQYWRRVDSGRHYSVGSCGIQSLPSSVREQVLINHQHTVDFDAASARYYLQLASRNEVDTPALKYYVESKESFRKALALYLDVSLKISKQLITAMLFGAVVPSVNQAMRKDAYRSYSVLSLFGDEAKALSMHEKLMSSILFKRFVKDVFESRKLAAANGYRSVFARFGDNVKQMPINVRGIKKQSAMAYQGFEAHALSVLIKQHDGDVTPVHDQVYSNKPISNKVLDEIEVATGFRMEFDSTSKESTERVLELLSYTNNDKKLFDIELEEINNAVIRASNTLPEILEIKDKVSVSDIESGSLNEIVEAIIQGRKNHPDDIRFSKQALIQNYQRAASDTRMRNRLKEVAWE